MSTDAHGLHDLGVLQGVRSLMLQALSDPHMQYVTYWLLIVLLLPLWGFCAESSQLKGLGNKSIMANKE